MIKKLFTVAFLASTMFVSAQQLKLTKGVATDFVPAQKTGHQSVSSTAIDTLMPASVMTGGCAVGTNTVLAGLVYYSIDHIAPMDSGYYFGTGKFPVSGANVTEIAQKYPSGTSGLSVTNVLTLAGKAHGTTATTSAKIYSETAGTLVPNAVLGTSTALSMSAYSASGYNNYSFGTPVVVAPNVKFFASITIPAFGGADLDTMAILSTKLGCSSTDSLSWMDIPPYGWHNVKSLFGSNLDLMIFPVVTITTTGLNVYSKGDVNLYAASPNPANNAININFSLNNASKVDIEVIDLTGKIVKSIKGNEVFSSDNKHTVSVDVTNLESGSYFYSINANGTKLFSKFVVAK
jgi:hypothetical protein